jgi:hypothetical protein
MMYFADKPVMSNDFLDDMSQADHEDVSIAFLTEFRDVYEERISSGEVDADDACGDKADMVEKLLFTYFDFRRPLVAVRSPSRDMTFRELVDFINDEVLHFISEEKPESFVYNKRDGKYHCVRSENNDD